MHLDGDVLDSAFSNPGQGFLDDWVRAEHGEVGFGNNLELHPRDFAEHHRELLVGLDVDDNSTRDAEVRAQVEATGHVVFLLVTVGMYEAIGDEEEPFEMHGIACFAKASGVPLKSSIYVADVKVEVDAGVGYTFVEVVEIKVEETVFELEVRAGVLD